jgi:hypothetical protein
MRIEAKDTLPEAMVKIAEGNNAAGFLLMQLYGAFNRFGGSQGQEAYNYLLRDFDRLGIYGSGLWILYKDVCSEDCRLMLLTLCAVDFGIIEKEELVSVIDTWFISPESRSKIDFDYLRSRALELLKNSVYEFYQ